MAVHRGGEQYMYTHGRGSLYTGLGRAAVQLLNINMVLKGDMIP